MGLKDMRGKDYKGTKKLIDDSGDTLQEKTAYLDDKRQEMSSSTPAATISPAREETQKSGTVSAPSAAAPYDFRALPEPEKTFERVKAVLCDKRLPHGVRSAAAMVCLEFFGSSDKQIINLSQTLTDERGFSLALRTSVLKTLKTAGLIEYEKIARQGTQITLLF